MKFNLINEASAAASKTKPSKIKAGTPDPAEVAKRAQSLAPGESIKFVVDVPTRRNPTGKITIAISMGEPGDYSTDMYLKGYDEDDPALGKWIEDFLNEIDAELKKAKPMDVAESLVEIKKEIVDIKQAQESSVTPDSGTHEHPHDKKSGEHGHFGLPYGATHSHEAPEHGGHRHGEENPEEGYHLNIGDGAHEHLQAKGLHDYISWVVAQHYPKHKWLPGHRRTWIRHLLPKPAEEFFRIATASDWNQHVLWNLHSTGLARPDIHKAVFLDTDTQMVEKEYEFEDGTRRPATKEDFKAETEWFSKNTPSAIWSRLRESGIESRYEALGIQPPEQGKMCGGDCEGTGWVPVYIAEADSREDGLTLESEKDPYLIALWGAAESANPTSDGWHFVQCPNCNGSGMALEAKQEKQAETIEESAEVKTEIVGTLLRRVDGDKESYHWSDASDCEIAKVPKHVAESTRRCLKSAWSAMTLMEGMRARKSMPSEYPNGFFRITTAMGSPLLEKTLRFRDGDTLSGWSILDEVTGGPTSPQTIEEAYRIQADRQWPLQESASAYVLPIAPAKLDGLNDFNNGKGIAILTDEGTICKGMASESTREYFIDGRINKGRLVFRKDDKRWFLEAKQEHQVPEILSDAERFKQRSDQYVPEEGEMAIPNKPIPGVLVCAENIPIELRWWRTGLDACQRLHALEDAREHLVAEGIIPGRPAAMRTQFILQRFVHESNGERTTLEYRLIWRESGRVRKVEFPEGLNAVASLKDGTIKAVVSWEDNNLPQGLEIPGDWFSLRSDKAIKIGKSNVFVERADEGTVEIYANNEDLITFKADGEKIKGHYVAHSLEGSQWSIERAHPGGGRERTETAAAEAATA